MLASIMRAPSASGTRCAGELIWSADSPRFKRSDLTKNRRFKYSVTPSVLLCTFCILYNPDPDWSQPVAIGRDNDPGCRCPQIHFFQINDVPTLRTCMHAFLSLLRVPVFRWIAQKSIPSLKCNHARRMLRCILKRH